MILFRLRVTARVTSASLSKSKKRFSASRLPTSFLPSYPGPCSVTRTSSRGQGECGSRSASSSINTTLISRANVNCDLSCLLEWVVYANPSYGLTVGLFGGGWGQATLSTPVGISRGQSEGGRWRPGCTRLSHQGWCTPQSLQHHISTQHKLSVLVWSSTECSTTS